MLDYNNVSVRLINYKPMYHLVLDINSRGDHGYMSAGGTWELFALST